MAAARPTREWSFDHLRLVAAFVGSVLGLTLLQLGAAEPATSAPGKNCTFAGARWVVDGRTGKEYGMTVLKGLSCREAVAVVRPLTRKRVTPGSASVAGPRGWLCESFAGRSVTVAVGGCVNRGKAVSWAPQGGRPLGAAATKPAGSANGTAGNTDGSSSSAAPSPDTGGGSAGAADGDGNGRTMLLLQALALAGFGVLTLAVLARRSRSPFPRMNPGQLVAKAASSVKEAAAEAEAPAAADNGSSPLRKPGTRWAVSQELQPARNESGQKQRALRSDGGQKRRSARTETVTATAASPASRKSDHETPRSAPSPSRAEPPQPALAQSGKGGNEAPPSAPPPVHTEQRQPTYAESSSRVSALLSGLEEAALQIVAEARTEAERIQAEADRIQAEAEAYASTQLDAARANAERITAQAAEKARELERLSAETRRRLEEDVAKQKELQELTETLEEQVRRAISSGRQTFDRLEALVEEHHREQQE